MRHGFTGADARRSRMPSSCAEVLRAAVGAAARVMVARQACQQVLERRALGGVERLEELVVDALDDPAQAGEGFRARRRERDQVAAAIARVAAALDQPPLLELVEDADEVATVEAECVGDRRLRLARLFMEQREDRVVVPAEADLLEAVDHALLRRVADLLEQIGGARKKLLRGPG